MSISPLGLGLMGAGSAVQGIGSYFGQKYAADAQTEANNRAIASKEKLFNQGLAYNQPYMQAGSSALRSLQSGIANGEYNAPKFRYSGDTRQIDPGYTEPTFNFKQDPGYQFRLGEGLKGVENSAAARGSQLSGGTLKALQRYGQNFASNEYNNAYGRFVGDRNYGRGNYVNDRDFREGRFIGNRRFNYGASMDAYNRGVDRGNTRFNRLNSLVQGGRGSAMGMMGYHQGQGTSLANLNANQGNINAISAQAPYQNTGKFIKDIGGLYSAYKGSLPASDDVLALLGDRGMK